MPGPGLSTSVLPRQKETYDQDRRNTLIPKHLDHHTSVAAKAMNTIAVDLSQSRVCWPERDVRAPVDTEGKKFIVEL